MNFIQEFETLYSDADEVMRLRSQESFSDFKKTWQLSVYYQIRYFIL